MNLLTGSSLEDYTVSIGNDTCNDIHVTDNRLECILPREQPSQNLNSHANDEAVHVIVSKVNVFYFSHMIFECTYSVLK